MKSAQTKPLNGVHKELFADGGLSGEGRVKDGKRHGKWTWYYKSGGLKAVGKYANGELDGYWEWRRENGKPLQVGSFNCGQQVGAWKRYYENGQQGRVGSFAAAKQPTELYFEIINGESRTHPIKLPIYRLCHCEGVRRSGRPKQSLVTNFEIASLRSQ